jgi:hypothetical protein
MSIYLRCTVGIYDTGMSRCLRYGYKWMFTVQVRFDIYGTGTSRYLRYNYEQIFTVQIRISSHGTRTRMYPRLFVAKQTLRYCTVATAAMTLKYVCTVFVFSIGYVKQNALNNI